MQGKIERVGAIVRSFNNPDVGRQVVNLLDKIGVGQVVVVTDKTRDKGVTPAQLSDIDDPRLSLHEMVRGYGWSNALNVGLRGIQMTNWERRSTGRPPFDFMLPLSVEAMLGRPHLEAMLDDLTDSRMHAMVGTTFAGEADGEPIDLGISYLVPRNTAVLINLDVFQCGIGGFDPQCDAEGGMEDLDLIVGVNAITGNQMRVRMLDLRVPLTVWRHYDQNDKEARERRALQLIRARWYDSYSRGTLAHRCVVGAFEHLERQGARFE